VAQQRSTSIRYKVLDAKEKKLFTGEGPAGGDGEPEWTDDQLAELEDIKVGYIDQIQQLGHDKRLFDDVSVGDKLARNVLGPHSLASFTTEWRAYPMTTWGAMAKGPTTVRAEALGYTKEMSGYEGDRRVERVNPELTDGAYYGPSRGHLQPRWARHVGMARGYGYGASMGAWVLDHVAAWAGEWGFITHSNSSYRTPAFTGDATFIDAEVVDKRVERRRHHIVTVNVEMRNQDDAILAKGVVEVELPAE
jgi:hypothetical protein